MRIVIPERYRVVRPLGEGMAGAVYEAVDTRSGRRIALKRVHDTTPMGILAVKDEFRELADYSHPHLLEVGELVVTSEDAFFTMELLESDASALLAVAEPERLPQLERLTLDVAHGLSALHGLGKVHRDLKPSNVLRDRSGVWRISDYGLMGTRGASAGFSGTPAYACPHALIHGTPSPAGDWYALGAMLYELASGHRPHSAPQLQELVLAKQRRRHRPITDLLPRSSAALGALIEELLDPVPSRRAGYERVTSSLREHRTRCADRLRRLSTGALVGRTAELRDLEASLDAACAGDVVAVSVEGSSGIGKTALIDAFAESMAGRGEPIQVLKARCRPEEHVASRALDAAIDELAAAAIAMPSAERERLFMGVPAALGELFPVLRAVLPDPGEGASLDPVEARAVAVRALVMVLDRLTLASLVVVVVDDVHWAHDEDLALLSALAACRGRLLLLVTARTAGAARVRERLAEGYGAVRVVSVAPLEPAASRALLGRLGVALQDDLLASVDEEARGHPLLLEEWALGLGDSAERPAVVSMDEVLARRVQAIEGPERQLLELTSLSTQPLDVDVASDLLGAPLAAPSLARLVKRKLLRWESTDAARIGPYHDRIRETVWASMSAGVRRQRHGELLDTLRERPATDAERLLPHALGAGRDAEAAPLASQAAADARARLAFAVEVEHLETAVALAARVGSEVAMLTAELGRARARCGRGEGAAEALLDAADLSTDADERLALELDAATTLLRTGHVVRGRQVLGKVLAGLDVALPRHGVGAIAAFLYWRARGLIGAPFAASPRPLGERDGLRLDALWAGATTLSMFDPATAAALQARLVAEAPRFDDPVRALRAEALHAAFLAALGGRYRHRSAALLERVRDRASKHGRPYEHAWLEATDGSVAWLAGDFRAAVEHTRRSRALFSTLDDLSPYELSLVDAWLLPALALQGALEPLAEAVAVAERAALDRGDVFGLATCRLGHPTIARLGSAGPERVRAEANEVIERCGGEGAPPTPRYQYTLAVAQAWLFEGRADCAVAEIHRAWPHLRSLRLFDVEMVAADLWYLRARAESWACRSGAIDASAARRTTKRAIAMLEGSTLRIAPLWARSLRTGDAEHDRGAAWERHGLPLHAALARGAEPVPMARALLPPTSLRDPA